jgi:hypothetical protein
MGPVDIPISEILSWILHNLSENNAKASRTLGQVFNRSFITAQTEIDLLNDM